MSELIRIFGDLKGHFVPGLQWVDVEEWLYAEEADEKVLSQRAGQFWALSMCRQATHLQEAQLQSLRDLAGVIRLMRDENQASYSHTQDNWASIIVESPASSFLAYIYALVSLSLPPQHVLQAAPPGLNSNLNYQLSLNAVSCYLLSLTIPGAKSYGVFDEDLIEQVLKIFRLLELNANKSSQANTIWMFFLTICDDLKLVFRHVHFKDHLKARDRIIRCLMEILYMNFKLGYQNSYAPALHRKVYELFSEITNEHNGDVYETLLLIMRQTYPMHIYTDSPQNIGQGRRGGAMQSGEHICDWFIQLIGKYPDILTRVLHFYIECVISNPIKSWKSTDFKVAIGYAAKYDSILFAKCNKSCSDFLLEAVKADDAVGIQTRALDLMEKILLQQSEVEWTIFRHEVSKVPREVHLLREVMRCLNDRTFTVRRKACQVLILALKQGSPMTRKILDESIQFVQFEDPNVSALAEPTAGQHELRFEKPGIVQFAYSFEGPELLEEEVKNLPDIVYKRFLQADNGIARAAGVTLIERLVLVNPLIMYNTNFVKETSDLALDKLASVRKSALETMETLLEKYSNCFALIYVYCRISAAMLNDEDVALQKLTLESFNRMVLKNIQPLEYCNAAKHFMPWRIVSTLFMTQPRAYLETRFQAVLEREPNISPKLVNVIISHLSTSMATDAWGLLLLLSSRITNNLDSLIDIFNSLSSYNMKPHQLMGLQLIIACLKNFSKSALNQLFDKLLSALRTGSIWLGLISSAVNLLNQIYNLSVSQAPTGAEMSEWLLNLLEDLTTQIVDAAENFQDEHTRLQCLLGTYTELIVLLPLNQDPRITSIVFKYLQECTKLNESQFDTDNERMINWMIVIAGRLCLRKSHLAHKVSQLYRAILNRNDRPQIINTTLIALSDLGKKHPSTLESNFQSILGKLQSKYAMTRAQTFRCVKDVILNGNIKLKGPILISMLSALTDESAEVARESDAFFIRYQKLYSATLFSHCLKECPFDLNGMSHLRGVRTDGNYKSPLRGPEMAKNRRLLYNHMLSTVDENTQLLYFGQLKLLAEKTKDPAFVSNAGALDVVHDMLFVMRRICYLTKGKGKEKSTRGEGDISEDGEDEPLIVAPSTSAQATSAAAQVTAKKGRGRKGVATEEPLKQLERCLRYVVETNNNLKGVMNPELRQSIDKLCQALAMRFPNYIDFAQPTEFWQKYRAVKSSKKGKKKKRQTDSDIDTDAEDEPRQTDESNSDNELPLERHKAMPVTSTRSQRKRNCDMIVTELIFQAPEW
ncbi:hypothetical protein KR018_009497 [Drosophila ironensis]|nr:hypothetical protein KR018_009497 [Drosophila ironensis]